ncbi:MULTISPECIES: Lrp/AsnC family transcriptional regulator [Streptomyces]|uniref:Lrp/AsnC family transcriptional regulator n=1 Tax=Streptomyces TaxID=1883 RepID=UPI00163B93BC|nr:MULTISPECIES: Lrp/AsnC family transcriptional regulator [Streptomyces]MBC2876455.1 Lrp/AsnC family transcriptional regulator [Streptomyces sp. TYQ1024]UBI40871.1 Lrp/AsnC family transcriptional regulator [Streptomyces mobaraensis]
MKGDTVRLDEVDRGLVHALQIDGRAPFRLVGRALGVSENTVARRYRRLRAAGILRVVGALNGARLGHSAWTIRLHRTPDAATAIARALAARPDTSYVHLLSGGTEISCGVRTSTTEESEALLLHKLPRTGRVTSVSAHLLLDHHALPGDWAGIACLTPERTALFTPPTIGVGEVSLEPVDRRLLELLSRDGRSSHAELAVAAGASESTVRRRITALRRAGVLTFLLDIPPAVLGFRSEARLWMSVRPSELTAVASAMARHPEVSLVARTTGPTNLLAAVNCRNALDLARYLSERIASLNAIRTMETAPVIRTVKRAGALLPVER